MNRNRFIILFNAVIMLVIAAFVFKYTNDDARARTESQINDFENITVAMEQVTTNYMEGEQRICDVWAHFINNRSMSMKDAVDFIRVSHVDSEASAHVIYLDDGSLEGFSTRPRTGTMADYAVSYASPELSALIDELEGDMKNGSDINVTRVYTNPMNGVQSLAFCNEIRLSDGGTQSRKALLMRLIPLSVLEDKWVFPREEYASAEVSIIDSGGNFIISGASFTETNFYDAFRSHNKTDSGTLREL